MSNYYKHGVVLRFSERQAQKMHIDLRVFPFRGSRYGDPEMFLKWLRRVHEDRSRSMFRSHLLRLMKEPMRGEGDTSPLMDYDLFSSRIYIIEGIKSDCKRFFRITRNNFDKEPFVINRSCIAGWSDFPVTALAATFRHQENTV